MIVPVRCWTCGKVLANKYETYKDKVAKHKKMVTHLKLSLM